MLNDVLMIVVGLALLVGGAQALVRGASRLALALGIPPLIVGLTIVAFGTSAPELAVSVQSSLSGNGAIVLGNVVGANVYNVLFILGLCAMITPLAVAPQLIRFDVPIMIGCAVALLLAARDGRVGPLEGTLFLAGIVVYTAFIVFAARREQPKVDEQYSEQLEGAAAPDRRYALHIVYMVVGIALLGLGSNLLVDGAVAIAQAFGVSDVLIGMTVVAVGTTSPELTACLVAAFKGQKDIAVGNIVGSNIFNVLAVLGTGAVVAGDGIVVDATMLDFGIPVMAVVCFACLPMFFAGHAINRRDGAVFLIWFVIYLRYIVFATLGDERLLRLQNAVIWFVAPLTIFAIAVSLYREIRQRRLRASTG